MEKQMRRLIRLPEIVFVLQQKDLPKFKRKGDEATKPFIKSNTGEAVKPHQFKATNDEGMPMYRRPFMRGKLYIHFTADFPDSLTPDQCKALEAVLPPKPASQMADMELDECEETTLRDVNVKEEMRRKQAQAQEAYEEDENDDDDDDVRGGAQSVQCAER